MAGCRAQSGLTAHQAETLWRQVLAFAGYGFNQGHATAYAAVSYRSAYLKAHYPAIFLWARLAVGGGFHHPAIYLAEAQRLGLTVRPPHVNHSGRRITLDRDGRTLWLGLGEVRDLRRSAAQALIAGRPFTTLSDVLARVALHEKEARHLIRCGALDGLGPSRAALLAEAEGLLRAESARQMAFDFGRPVVSAESLSQRLAWEQEILGLPVSAHRVAAATRPGIETVGAPLVTLGELEIRPNTTLAILAARLPGWTGGEGFFLSDGHGLITADPAAGSKQSRPVAWDALWLRGQWRLNNWSGGSFSVQAYGRLRWRVKLSGGVL